MRVSQAGIVVLLGLLIISGTSCSYYNRVLARKNVVDGVEAFKSRKYAEAEELFKRARDRAPEGSEEQRFAILYLARTLHSDFVANRDTAKDKAEAAIPLYQKALEMDPKDQVTFRAVASLYKNLKNDAEWLSWVTARSQNADIYPVHRTEAYTLLAIEQDKCAGEIIDNPEVKKKVEKDGKADYAYTQPADKEDLNKLKGCIQKGMELIGKALETETTHYNDKSMSVDEAKGVAIEPLSDKDLRAFNEAIRPFEQARGFRFALLRKSSYLAEMEGRNEDKDKFRKEAEAANEKYKEMTAITKAIKDETEKRAKIAAGVDANTNANTEANK
jgi:tetratricopeptide (TPR) repeat protein